MVKSYQGYETLKCLPLGLCGHAVMPEIDMSCRRLALNKIGYTLSIPEQHTVFESF